MCVRVCGSVDEQLTCDQESGNQHDTIAMVIAESCKKFDE